MTGSRVAKLAIALGALMVCRSIPADAQTTILNLKNTIGLDSFFVAEFTATSPTTTLYVGGYDVPTFSATRINNVQGVLFGGTNLLQQTWSLERTTSGSLAFQTPSMSGVNDLVFGGKSAGFYDTFYQSFATTPGLTYQYSFLYDSDGVSNGLRVSVDSIPNSVPEPSAWAMMLLGLSALGLLARRKHKENGTETLARA